MTPQKLLLLGPPGTGKTTALLGIVGEWRDNLGIPIEEIAVTTFTRAGAYEARDRFGGRPPWFGTLHSLFARLLDLRCPGDASPWMQDADYRAFLNEYGYEISAQSGSLDDEIPERADMKRDDPLMRALDFARSRMLAGSEESLNQALGFLPPSQTWGIDLPSLCALATRYRAFKTRHGKYDFTDILEIAVRKRVRLPVRALAVDEAQDLSPLQQALLASTMAQVEVLLVAGDDDQAIYAFAGATPDWLVSLAGRERWPSHVLDRSWRLPIRVHTVAERIIGRNHHRVAKQYQPRPEAGTCQALGLDAAVTACWANGSAFVLARTRRLLEAPARLLFGLGTPYVVERGSGPNPMGAPKKVAAIRTALVIRAGAPVTVEALSSLLDLIPTSRKPDALAPWGVKVKVTREPADLLPTDLDRLGLGRLLQAIRKDSPAVVLQREEAPTRTWWRRLLERYGDVPEPRVRITTIHGSKGREADSVVVLSDWPPVIAGEVQTIAGYEAENRVQYVAATRARQQLFVVPRRGYYGMEW